MSSILPLLSKYWRVMTIYRNNRIIFSLVCLFVIMTFYVWKEELLPLMTHKFTKTVSLTEPGWKCCTNSYTVNNNPTHLKATMAQEENHNYMCPENPSNFSYYFSKESLISQRFIWSKWNTKISLVGGSTTRQMYEQYLWEKPQKARTNVHYAGSSTNFLFEWEQVGGCCNYNRTHILNTLRLAPDLILHLKSAPNFLIFNVGSWWSSKAIGTVIDEQNTTWSIHGTPPNQEWISDNNSTTNSPDLSFANLMERAIIMMKEKKNRKTTLIWRSETHTDCPVGSSYRSSVVPVLQKHDISILNISQATCNYLALRNNYDRSHTGPHLCFPSVALRYWLLEFQHQFL